VRCAIPETEFLLKPGFGYTNHRLAVGQARGNIMDFKDNVILTGASTGIASNGYELAGGGVAGAGGAQHRAAGSRRLPGAWGQALSWRPT
jgi:hypothetical protein